VPNLKYGFYVIISLKRLVFGGKDAGKGFNALWDGQLLQGMGKHCPWRRGRSGVSTACHGDRVCRGRASKA